VKLVKQNSSDYINELGREYGLYTLDKRAIPAVTDGLKSSQRIALWLLSKKPKKIKTVALSGEMISSELYLHGDVSASDTISLLAAPYCNNNPLITGEGSFGTRVNPHGIASPRYTYVKKSKEMSDVLYQDMPILPMTENHDGSNTMPRTFLPLLPLVLLNSVTGIATGWSTEILPRNIKDIKSAVLEVLNDGKLSNLLFPHFELYNIEMVLSGENKYIVRGALERVNTTTVHVTELPPSVTLEQFQKRLNALQEDGTITDYTNKSTDAINVIIKFKRATLSKYDDNKLMKLLRVETTTTERIVVQGFEGDTIVQYDNPQELVKDWVKWRLEWYLDRYQKLLADAEHEALYWLYILSVFDAGITKKLMDFKDKAKLKEWVIEIITAEDYEINQELIERMLTRPIYKWTEEGLTEAERKVDELDTTITKYDGIVNSNTKRKNIFKKEVMAL